MISDRATAIFVILFAVIIVFFVWSLRRRQRLHLLHKLYLFFAGCFAVWILAMIGMRFTSPDNIALLAFWDAVTQAGNFCATLYLLISITITRGYTTLPKRSRLLFLIPVLSTIICFTNPLHHLQYVRFSIIRSEIVFGPFFPIAGGYSYICLITSIVMLITFSRKASSSHYRKQCLLIALGGTIPLLVSIIASLSIVELPITATPLSFVPTTVFNGLAIYQLHLMDIIPVATQQVLDQISNCYLLLSEKGLILSYNQPFSIVFGAEFGITEKRYLKDCIKDDDVSRKTAIYNMIAAVDACRESHSTISYEQAATTMEHGVPQKSYYMTDVSPLNVSGQSVGYIIIFKDVTQLKKSMQQLQDSETRMMEQERFAFLGQMIGGLAHNLKTPIMSISGCVAAADSLIDECLASLDDPVVTSDDYREIYGEIRDWFRKIQESSAYMSDIITTIKGQVTSDTSYAESLFTADELVKRTTLLMRHELLSGGCTLVSESDTSHNVPLRGDINNLVQVLGNLLSNAIYAQKQMGGGIVTLGVQEDGDQVQIYVKDTGPGIPPNVRDRLFKEMVTSKGAQGTGLGLYISNAVVRSKFGGSMWAKENPGGGTIIGMNIPIGNAASSPVPDKGGEL